MKGEKEGKRERQGGQGKSGIKERKEELQVEREREENVSRSNNGMDNKREGQSGSR